MTRGYLNILKTEEASFGTRHICVAHPEPAVWKQLQESERRFLNAEEVRLRYVAATRAGAMLIVSQRQKGSEKNPWCYFADFLKGQEEAPDPQASEAAAPARTSLDLPAFGTEIQAIEQRFKVVTSPSYRTAPAREYAAALFDSGTLPPRIPAIRLQGDWSATGSGEHGVEWGRVIHALLELAMNHPGMDIRGPAELLLREQELDPLFAEQATVLVERVMKSDIWKRALRARRRMTEVPFTILEEPPGSGQLPVVVRGVIDLLFEEEDGWVLVDYKTDAVDASQAEALAAGYTPQLEYYARTFSRLSGLPVKQSLLYFLAL